MDITLFRSYYLTTEDEFDKIFCEPNKPLLYELGKRLREIAIKEL